MESGTTQLNHYQDSQTTIHLQNQQPTTSNGRPIIQLHNTGHIRTNTSHCLQQNYQQQQQHLFSQPSTATNFDSNGFSYNTTYRISANSNPAPNIPQQQPQNLPSLPPSLQPATQNSQNPYQFKCSLLEYHIHEAILINKALRSELQEYKEKIAFEKKLRTVLVDRVKSFTP